MLEIIHRKKRLSSFKLIALGFAGVIVLGALILMLPFSSNTGSVTFNLRCLRYGACCAGYRQLLVRFRAGGDFAAYSDRRTWRCDRCCNIYHAFRQKNIADATQHHAGCHFSPKSRRHRSPDCTWDFSDRTYRNGCHATGILQRSRFQRNLDGGVSFGLRFLQCRIRHTRHHRKQISISYGIRRRADNKHCNYDFNYRGRHWLFDLG
jgi:hypothetical protein